MKFVIITVAVAFTVPVCAKGATLAADSLLCEAEPDVQKVDQMENLRAQPGSMVMKRVAAGAEMWKLDQEISRRLYTGQRADNKVAEAQANEATYRRLQTSCAESGSAQQAEVIERRAISGLTKIRVQFRGRPAELWTTAGSVTE